jgi:hypothetical protein
MGLTRRPRHRPRDRAIAGKTLQDGHRPWVGMARQLASTVDGKPRRGLRFDHGARVSGGRRGGRLEVGV